MPYNKQWQLSYSILLVVHQDFLQSKDRSSPSRSSLVHFAVFRKRDLARFSEEYGNWVQKNRPPILYIKTQQQMTSPRSLHHTQKYLHLVFSEDHNPLWSRSLDKSARRMVPAILPHLGWPCQRLQEIVDFLRKREWSELESFGVRSGFGHLGCAGSLFAKRWRHAIATISWNRSLEASGFLVAMKVGLSETQKVCQS